jgi:hypothetical protein
MTTNRNSTMMPTATRSSLLLASLLAVAGLQAQTNNIAINNNGAAPDPSAILDVNTNLTGAATRGMLPPRVVSTASITVGPTTDGMLVYQTGAPAGYYYYNATIPAWVAVQNAKDGWSTFGNPLPFPAQEFLGTTDAQDLSFRTNNVERMRLDATGELGIGVPAPTERLDVGGAMRIFNAGAALRTVIGAPIGFNGIHSLSDGVGVIEFQKDTIKAALPAAPNQRRLMWPGHYGNITGTGVVATGVSPNSGGWRRMNNDYTEVFNAPYTINGDVTCGAGNAELPSPALSPLVPANLSSSLLPLDQVLVNPFMNNTLATRRERMQFMFLRNELNAELNQLYGVNGTPSTAATNGICAGQPITSIGFWVNQTLGVIAGTGAGQHQKLITYAVTVKHAPAGVNNLNTGFEVTNDPAQGCGTNTLNLPTASAGPSWSTFTLTTPFVWDGVRNVIVEVVIGHGGSASNIALPIKVYTVPGAAPASNLTYTESGTAIIAGCTTLGLPGSCAFGTSGGGIVTNACGTAGISRGATNKRPVIQFGGTVSTITPFITSTGPYMQYDGGLVAEDPATTPPWGWQTTPYYAFKGPGTVSAQRGVFDNTVRLNDHVFDRAFDGKVRPEDAANFGDRRNLGMGEMAQYIERERHLPTIKGRSDWNREGSFSLGDMANQLWTTTETQSLYLTELHDRLNLLELLTNDRPVEASEFDQARTLVVAMQDLTEQQKAALVQDLKARVVTSNGTR